MKFHAIHADQHDLLPGPLGLADFVLGPYGTGQVDVAQDDTAEDRAVRIGVRRHHHDLDSQETILARRCKFARVHLPIVIQGRRRGNSRTLRRAEFIPLPETGEARE